MTRDTEKTQYLFMFGGQGSQYYQMGSELYHNNPCFKQTMNDLAKKVQTQTGRDILAEIYGASSSRDEFDDITCTHPALFCIGYSLAQLLIEQGVEPDGVIGYSLGEYIAATLAGMLDLDDALRLVIEQARQLAQYAPPGGLMAVIAPPDTYHQRQDIFAGVDLGGINFENSFLIAGHKNMVESVKQKLDNEEILSVKLPVRYGFHSRAIDDIESHQRLYLGAISVRAPRIPIYSPALVDTVNAAQIQDPQDYLWGVVRNEINFHQLMSTRFTDKDNHFFIDLSATGSLSNFLKYSKVINVQHNSMINQFGKNLDSMATLMSQLRP